jgi:nucleotide-binding universal stress UspA family protein
MLIRLYFQLQRSCCQLISARLQKPLWSLVHIIPETPDFNGSDFFPETSVLQERREIIEEKLDARKEQLMLEGVPASFSIETDNDIVGSLMRVIQREKADMVVISTHGMSGWRPLVFGSIAEQVIKHVSCTLLLLQSHQPAVQEPASEARENSFVPDVSVAGHLGR